MRFQRAKSRGLPFSVEIALAQVLGSSERQLCFIYCLCKYLFPDEDAVSDLTCPRCAVIQRYSNDRTLSTAPLLMLVML